MKKFKKFLLIFIISVVVIFIGAIVALRIAFPPEKLKGILITKMSEFLHREIEIKNVSIGFRGLEVDDLKVSERPSFKEGTFVEAKQFLIMPDLFAILRKQISISKIVLKSPKINIVRYKDNSFNFSDLMPKESTVTVKQAEKQPEGKSAKKESTGKEAVPFSFLVSRVALSDGGVKFVDMSVQAMSAELKNIDVSLSGISLISSFSVDVSVDALFKNMEGSLSFSGIVNLAQQSLKIKQAIVSTSGAGLKVSGDIYKFMNPETLNFNINVKNEKLALEKFAKLAPLPKGFSVSGEPKIDVNVSGNINKIQIKGSVDAKNVDTKFEDMFSKPKDMETLLTVDLVLDNNDILKINNISAVLNTIKTSVSGKVSGISKNKIVTDMNIVLEKFDLKLISQIVPMAKDFGISGLVEDETRIAGDLKTISVTGKAKVQNVQSVQKDMTAKITGSEVNYSVNIANSKEINITFNVDGDTIDINMPEPPKQASTPV